MKHVTRDGVKLAYVEEGAGPGRPMVLVHGWTCHHRYFAPQAEHFGPGRRCVSVDLRGHGESDKPEAKYSITGFADDVAFLCDELGIERPIVVGHSMGGMTAVEVARRHPSLPSAVVAVDSPIVVFDALAQNLAGLAQQIHSPDWRPAHRAFLEAALFIASDDPARRAAILRDMTSAPEHVIKGCFDAIVEHDSAGAVAGCRVPFLYLAAEAWLADPAKLRQANPRVVLGQTVGAGHFSQLEVPDQVNPMIERFLAVAGVA